VGGGLFSPVFELLEMDGEGVIVVVPPTVVMGGTVLVEEERALLPAVVGLIRC